MTKSLFFAVLIPLFMAAPSLAADKNCFEEQTRKAKGTNEYSVTFNAETALEKNKSGNYSKRYAYKRNFACVLFSKKEVLSGSFKATQGYYLKSTCDNKSDYAYMQFATPEGKEIFRIQCEKVAYEDQESVKFVPSSEDIQDLMSELVTVQ